MKFEIYLPTALDDSFHQIVKQALVAEFGGLTITQGAGCWADDTGAVIEEEVAAYTSLASAFILAESFLINFGEDLARTLLRRTHEDTILFSVGGSGARKAREAGDEEGSSQDAHRRPGR